MNKIKLKDNFDTCSARRTYTEMLLTTAFLSPKPLEALLSLSSTVERSVISRNSTSRRPSEGAQPADVWPASSSCLSIIAIASRSHAYVPR